jgi:hypothetical protein
LSRIPKYVKMKNYLLILLAILFGCTQSPDFKTFPKIDSHVHLETADDSFVEIVEENNFKLISLVTRSESPEVIRNEFNFAQNLQAGHPKTIGFATTISMDGFGEEGWEENTISWLQESFDNGALGVKIWKILEWYSGMLIAASFLLMILGSIPSLIISHHRIKPWSIIQQSQKIAGFPYQK